MSDRAGRGRIRGRGRTPRAPLALAAAALLFVATATPSRAGPPAPAGAKAPAAGAATRAAPAPPPDRPPSPEVVPPGNLKLFAAASLQNVLAEVAGAFELKHPGVHVVTGVAGSAELRAQIEKGADADVFLSADTNHVAALVRGGLCDSVRILTRNHMAVLTRKGGPVKTLADLGVRGIRVVICAPDVPAGRYAGQVLDRMTHARGYGPGFVKRVKANLVSHELNVRTAVTKVALGEADAAFAYPTDLELSRKRLAVIPLSDTLDVPAVYGVTICRQGRNPIAAAQYVRLLFTAPVRGAFLRHGFAP